MLGTDHKLKFSPSVVDDVKVRTAGGPSCHPRPSSGVNIWGPLPCREWRCGVAMGDSLFPFRGDAAPYRLQTLTPMLLWCGKIYLGLGFLNIYHWTELDRQSPPDVSTWKYRKSKTKVKRGVWIEDSAETLSSAAHPTDARFFQMRQRWKGR